MSENQVEQGKRLKQARIAQDRYTTGADAARAMGAVVATYLGHENGSRGYKAEASRYADFYKVNLEWLLTGRGVMKRGELPGVSPERPPSAVVKEPSASETIVSLSGAHSLAPWPRDLRVLGLAECGPDGWSLWNGEVIEMTSRPPNLAGATQGYAVYVAGISMEPRYFEGELVYIHPGKPISIGDFVLVQVRPEEGESTPRAVIKRLVKRSPTKITLEQFNPKKQTEIKAGDIISMHQIVGSGKA